MHEPWRAAAPVWTRHSVAIEAAIILLGLRLAPSRRVRLVTAPTYADALALGRALPAPARKRVVIRAGWPRRGGQP